MFLAELHKYHGYSPMQSMFEDLDEEAFILLLKYSTVADLKRILHMSPGDRPDILGLVMLINEEKATVLRRSG